MVGNQLAEDILDFNRCQEQFLSLMPDNVRDNIDIEGFGYRWDDKSYKWLQNWDANTTPGIKPGNTQIVSFKPFLGLVLQPKLLPVKYAPIILEFSLVNSNLDPIISPGVKNFLYEMEPAFTNDNTGSDWQIEKIVALKPTAAL